MLWVIVALLVLLWLLGYGFWIAAVGPILHLLLVIAIVIALFQLLYWGRRTPPTI